MLYWFQLLKYCSVFPPLCQEEKGLVVVTLSMTWVGLLVINSLLVLPAAAARNVARNMDKKMPRATAVEENTPITVSLARAERRFTRLNSRAKRMANVARNMRQYHLFSLLGAVLAGIAGLMTSYYVGGSAGAAI